jgi:Zn2+/Cd2+-exporting ATPase
MKWLSKGKLVSVTGVCIITALVFQFIHFTIMSDIIFWIATILAGYPIAKNAFQAITLKVISIELLVTVAVIGALFIGEYSESAAVTFLFILGSYLEHRTLEKTRSSLKSLLDLAPLEARIVKDGKEEIIAAEDVQEKDILFIHSGEKVPADGRVIDGEAHVNEAAITGESIPVQKKANDKVFSGTIIDNGYLKIEAQKVGEDTTFSKILQLVEEAQDTKAKTQKFIEKFATYYTPSILVLSIGVFIITRDIRLALTFLVISCPGALVISAPVSIVAGIGNGAKRGILIKGGEITERAAKLSIIAFDKTGTLTVGKPQVAAIKTIEITENELLAVSAKAESFSEHHLARAIMDEAAKKGVASNEKPENFQVFKGMGVIATIDGNSWLIGNRKMMAHNQVKINDDIEQYVYNEEVKGRTAVIIANGQQLKGIISISDRIRPEAAETIRLLKKAGKKVIMLTGDNERTAATVAAEVGISDYFAGLLPEQKVAKIKELQASGLMVGMVGDGINDAPAIATADVGIAMGGAGTDAAMETADIILMADRMEKLPFTLNLAQATVRNMQQNMFFAVSIVILLLVGVLSKTVFLASGMLIHELSVLIVILNAIRLLKFKSSGRSPINTNTNVFVTIPNQK